MIGGVAFFVAAERATAAALDACELRFPSHVTGLCAVGLLASVPAIGGPMQLALGPATAWLRATLPCTLVPAFLFPAVCELPSNDALPKLAALAAGGVLVTCAATGHFATALVRGAATQVATPCMLSVSRATAALASPLTACAALGLGGLASAVMSACEPVAPVHQSRAAAYIGLTVACYVAAARWTPAAIKRYAPPNIGCAVVLLPILCVTNGAEEVRTYLDGAGAYLLLAVKPAMVTLGLYTHTHRAVMLPQLGALLALATIVAPSLLFATAWAGRALSLEPRHVASVLPASTTTGLALTWPSGMPLVQSELVAAGTAFNSMVSQVTLPLLLGATMLRTPFGRGVGIGCSGHIGGMAALAAAGEAAAADAAAVALVVVGVTRSVLVQVPAFSRSLSRACGETESGTEK